MSSAAAIVIPARLGSRRFARKVLVRDTGKFLVEHVWEAVQGTRGVDRVIIATDSREVEQAARSFGADVRLTSDRHVSGTDRVAEVARDLDEDIIVNVQGDEPLICREDLGRLVDSLRSAPEGPRKPPVMATLARPRTDAAGFADPNIVKVVVDDGGTALYFSRASIPSQNPAGDDPVSWLQHVGIYGFRRDFLLAFSDLQPGRLERLERLEQLRVLENGEEIRVLLTENEYAGIDTEEDYREFVKSYRSQGRASDR